MFFIFLIALFGILIGDAINESEHVIETNNDVLSKSLQDAKAIEQYFTMGEIVTAFGALISGIISVATKKR